MTDFDELSGFFYSSRYVSIDVMNRYGMNPNNYSKESLPNLMKLRKQISKKIHPNVNVNTKKELVELLGREYHWVRTGSNFN
jgi:hypothetical protein